MAVLISSGMTAVGGVFYAFYYNNLFPSQVFDISALDRAHPGADHRRARHVFGPMVGAFILTPLGGDAARALIERLGINAPGAKAMFYGVAYGDHRAAGRGVAVARARLRLAERRR